jgi:hypothetical protein
MALTECAECGGKVSDKAPACPHCGAPVEIAQVACTECGTKISANAPSCPKCGAPTEVMAQRAAATPAVDPPVPQGGQPATVQASPPAPVPVVMVQGPPPQALTPLPAAGGWPPTAAYVPPPQAAYQPAPPPVAMQVAPERRARAAKPSAPIAAKFFLMGLMGVPVLLLVVHALLFSAGLVPIVVLCLMATAATGFVMLSVKLSMMTGRQLVHAVTTRRTIWMPALAVVVMAEAVAVPQGCITQRARQRIDQALVAQDPCAAGSISTDDRERAASSQLNMISTRGEECTTGRVAEADEAKKRQHEQQCAAAAAAVETGGATADQDAVLGADADLAKRIAAKSISSSDLRSVGKDSVPCAGTAAAARFWAAYVLAATASSTAWTEIKSAAGVHADLRNELKAGPATLTEATREALAKKVEDVATKAAGASTTSEMAGAISLCELAADIKAPAAGPCAYLQGKRNELEAREEKAVKAQQAKAAAEQARTEAAERAKAAAEQAKTDAADRAERAKGERCGAVQLQAVSCTERCADIEDLDRSMACAGRCDAMVKAAGCE